MKPEMGSMGKPVCDCPQWHHFQDPGNRQYSLIPPVQSGSDVALHVLHPVVGKMADEHLPPQV